MCGIFGSNSRDRFYDLYVLNRDRGAYSSGIYCYRGTSSCVLKTDEELTIDDIPADMEYYLGHNRAPTASATIYTERTCHPFQSRFYWYAHNGIINHIKHQEKYNCEYDVDSQWIGHYLDTTHFIKDTLEEISSDPFAVWIASRSRPKVFSIARVANPIYRSADRTSFSSAQFEDSELIKEGQIYSWSDNKIINTLATFKYKSPYFIPG